MPTTELKMPETVTLTFAVPSDLALTFQAQAHGLLDDLMSKTIPTEQPDEFTPLSKSDARELEVWRQPNWTEADADRIRWAVADLPRGPLQVLAFLVENAGRWVTSGQIAEECGLKGPKSVPPSFKSLAFRCRRTGRRPMWDYDPDEGYLIQPATAQLFEAAVRDRLAS